MTNTLVFGPYRVNRDRREVTRNGRPVPLGGRAFDLLLCLLEAGGRLVTKDELMESVWPGAVVEENNIQVQVSTLRKALADEAGEQRWIVTVPGRGYRFFRDPNLEQGDKNAGLRVPDRPSIAVLPFVNLGGSADQEYLADGLSEEIIMALTRHRWFFVMSRNSSFVFKGRAVDHGEIAAQLGVRYLLEGSIRRSAYRVRVAATLSDAASGTAMWSESYDRELADILAIQEEIAARVAGALEPELLKAEGSRAARAVGDLGAWDLVRQGTWYFHQVTEATSVRARQLFREAVRKDPQLCEAHMWLARVSVLLAVYGWVDDVAGVLNEAHRAALRAIELDERDPYSHYALSMACMYSHAHDAAIRAARRCIELNPSFALGHAALSQALLCAGLAAHALEPIEYGLRLNPYDPQNFHWWRILAVARLLRGENDRALEAALRALDLRPSWRLSLDTALLCYAALKRWKEAAECIAEIEMSAQVKSDPIAVLGLQHPQWDALRRDALAHAGVAAQ